MDGLQHHAIIPTVPDTAPKVFEDAYNKLTPPQQRVMDLIVVRLFGADSSTRNCMLSVVHLITYYFKFLRIIYALRDSPRCRYFDGKQSPALLQGLLQTRHK
jgi:hypothetical protein